MGRRADNPDVYEFTDAFILGMMGGKGGRLSGNVMTSMSSYMGHNKNFVNRMAMENVIRRQRLNTTQHLLPLLKRQTSE